MRILIVEDNAAFRDSLRTLLCSHEGDIEVLEDVDGSAALALTDAYRPDLVFVDIQLPDRTGLAITRDLKRHYPSIPVAILTSYDLPEYRAAADHCGANYFLGKDTSSADEILHLVDYYLHH